VTLTGISCQARVPHVLGRHIPRWASTVLGRLAVEDIGGVGDVNGHFVPGSRSPRVGQAYPTLSEHGIRAVCR
jgi:hypothetical protein